MEQTTLQQRIEERAKQRLLTHLKAAYDKEHEIRLLIGEDYPRSLLVSTYYGYGGNNTLEIGNDFTLKLFDKLLPSYIKRVTDEILQSIDEMKILLDNK